MKIRVDHPLHTRLAHGNRHSYSIYRAPPESTIAEGMTGLTLDEMETWIPGINSYLSGISRQLGNFMLAMGVLLMGIAAFPYRKGEKWAWYTYWIIPVLLVIQIANSLATGGFLWQVDFGGLVIVLAGLFLPFRKFFPKAQARKSPAVR